jgi:hypothetical protein
MLLTQLIVSKDSVWCLKRDNIAKFTGGFWVVIILYLLANESLVLPFYL